MRINKIVTGCGALAVACGSMAAVAAPAPLLSYNFDETGTSANNGGTGTPATGALVNTSGALTDYHGAAGSGVSGAAGDRALDLSAETSMAPNPGTVGGERVTNPSIQALQSFTVAGFFKTDGSEVIGNNARLFVFQGTSAATTTAGIFISASGNGQLGLQVDTVGTSTAANVYSDAGAWTFFAITYDGTQNPANVGHTLTSNVKFYKGTTGASPALTLVSTNTVDALSVDTLAGATNYAFVGTAGGGRTFDGLLDNIQLYGSTTDATGALSATDVQALYTAATPEPASLGVLAAGAGLLVRRRRAGR